LSERLITYFGQKKCFYESITLIALSVIFMVVLVARNNRNPGLITSAMVLYVSGSVCPINILCPHAYMVVPGGKGKLNALVMSFKMASISFLVQITSYFYSENFRSIGSVVALTLIFVIFMSWRLLKIDPILSSES
jgi:hypothetical protein